MVPIAFFSGLMVIAFIVALISPSEPTSSNSVSTSKSSPSEKKPTGQYFTKEGYYAAKTEEGFKKLNQIIFQKDDAAFQQMLEAGLIFRIPPNQKVFFTGCHGTLCSIVTFRYEGQIEEYWTYNEAISKD
jgi:hypothetical protein